MAIENIMYFVLGLLSAGLLALMIVPAIWRRAVRLTKKRIEAATPVSLAEFRADKDQLRAEFALTTRKLEMTVETLRKRLAEQLSEFDQQKVEVSALRVEREHHRSIVAEHEAREAEARQKVLDLEREGADLAQRLRKRERELADKVAELAEARNASASASEEIPEPLEEVREDIDAVMASLAVERRRVQLLETRTQGLLDRIEQGGARVPDMSALAGELRAALAASREAASDRGINLAAAEARITNAEQRLSALLLHENKAEDEAPPAPMLAEQLSGDDRLEQLRGKVGAVEDAILTTDDMAQLPLAGLRQQLGAIARDVSRIVYSTEGAEEVEREESLFDRVRRFAGDDLDSDDMQRIEVAPEPERTPGPIAQRMAALQQMRGRR